MFARKSISPFTLLTALLAVAFIALAVTREPDNERRLRSYYFEATLDIQNAHVTDVFVEEPFQRLRAWYEAPDRWRREYAYADEGRRELGTVQISNGSEQMTYDGRTNAYSVWELEDDYRRFARAIPGSFLIGPLPVSVEQMQATSPEGWQRAGTETVLGTDVTVFRTGPQGSGATIWVDVERDFVLRYVSNDPRQPVTVNVTSLQYNHDVPDAQFQFVPPAAARKVDPPARRQTGSSSSTGPIGGSSISVPPGFLTPAYLPSGYETTATSFSSGLLGQPSTVGLRLQPAGLRSATGPFLSIDQQLRSGGMPDAYKTGSSVAVGGEQAYLTTTGDEVSLVFAIDSIVVTLRSNVLPAEELRRIAESMRKT